MNIKKETLMKLFHTIAYALIVLSLYSGISLLEAATKKKPSRVAQTTRERTPLTKEQYLARCEARYDCRENCSPCKTYSQCLHNKMQGKKGRNVLRDAVKSCKADRKKCTSCNRECMKAWRNSQRTTQETPSRRSETAKKSAEPSVWSRIKEGVTKPL